MFENVGNKLKTVSEMIFVFGTIIIVIATLVLTFLMMRFILVPICGLLAVVFLFIFSLLLYGVGEMNEKLNDIKYRLDESEFDLNDESDQ